MTQHHPAQHRPRTSTHKELNRPTRSLRVEEDSSRNCVPASCKAAKLLSSRPATAPKQQACLLACLRDDKQSRTREHAVPHRWCGALHQVHCDVPNDQQVGPGSSIPPTINGAAAYVPYAIHACSRLIYLRLLEDAIDLPEQLKCEPSPIQQQNRCKERLQAPAQHAASDGCVAHADEALVSRHV